MCEQREKLLSLTPPAVPFWGVFFVPGEPDDILLAPVVTLAMVEEPEGRFVRPLCFDRLYGVEEDWRRESEALGFLLEHELSMAAEIFADDIVYERNKQGAVAE